MKRNLVLLLTICLAILCCSVACKKNEGTNEAKDKVINIEISDAPNVTPHPSEVTLSPEEAFREFVINVVDEVTRLHETYPDDDFAVDLFYSTARNYVNVRFDDGTIRDFDSPYLRIRNNYNSFYNLYARDFVLDSTIEEVMGVFIDEIPNRTPIPQEESDVISYSSDEAYNIYKDFVREYHQDHPNATYSSYNDYFYSEEGECCAPLYIRDNNPNEINNVDVYEIDENRQVVYRESFIDDYNHSGLLSYDVFMNCPVILNWEEFDKIETSIPDGHYSGAIYGISMDGTEALVSIGEAVYKSLLSDINLTCNDGNYVGTFTYNGVVYDAADFDNEFLEAVSECDTSSDGVLQGPSDVTYSINRRLAILPIAADCTYEASGPWAFYYDGSYEFGTYSYVGSYLDTIYYEPNNQSYSHYYRDFTTSNYISFGWAYILEPIEVTNGQITRMSFGVR